MKFPFPKPSPLHWIAPFADALRARRGWKRVLTAFFCGALAGLAFPPVDAVPLLWLCFPALIFMLQGAQDMKRAFLIGWSFAFGFGIVSYYWIAGALFVDIGHFWWVLPFAVCGLPACLAIYYGLAAMIAWRIGPKGIAGSVAFALLWFLADYARGHLFTGFPWDIYGYAWAEFLPVLQAASVAGIYGLTLLTILCASLPACLADNTRAHRMIVAGSLIALALIAVWGSLRMDKQITIVPHVRLRLVQPNMSQRLKWQPEMREANFQKLLSLSSAPGAQPVTHIIWPETAATFYLEEDPVHRQEIADLVPAEGEVITGVIRRAQDENGVIHYYNSLVAVDGRNRIVAGYDKHHLVPFGEYIPFRHYLPLPVISQLGIDFSTGDGVRTLRVLGLPPFSPLICYEAIFPGEVADRDDPPRFLLNVTNDGWYDHTTGPYQHFAISRVRAVEEGLPLVRAANKGIDVVTDGYGRLVARLGWGEPSFIDSDLPEPLSAPTLFSRYGEKPLWILFGLLAAGVLVETARRKIN